MVNDDCLLPSAQLLEIRYRMGRVLGDLGLLRDEVAEMEGQTPYHCPGPFCGYISQARNALALSVDAVNEILLSRDAAEAAEAVQGPGGVEQKVPSNLA